LQSLKIIGGNSLHGAVSVDGSKNAALPIMAASIAVSGVTTLRGIPALLDVATMIELLISLGVVVQIDSDSQLTISSGKLKTTTASPEIVRRMRAGICVLGPLLARFGSAQVALPGGCQIGARPIDLHLKGLAALGADIRLENGFIVAKATKLRGSDIQLSGPSGSTVTGTCNVMVAAATASGKTVIQSAACEPEVRDLGNFLNAAGARVTGHGTSTIEIQGVDQLSDVAHPVISDRIEAATLAIAAAITRSEVLIRNAPLNDLQAVLEAFEQIGVPFRIESTTGSHQLRILTPQKLNPVSLTAESFPGLPTDTQAQFSALLATIPGNSIVTDTIFPERFMHVAELMRMGARIELLANVGAARIQGVPRLHGATVRASDLRASAALVLAAIAADGVTEILGVEHLDRGYASLDRKLNSLGASISRVNADELDSRSSVTLNPPHFFVTAPAQRMVFRQE
jgi:UDP-N-acetylglucosamine 1-carboxyvinyltransferase